MTLVTDNKLHQSPNAEIEFTRSYKCNSDQTLYFNESQNIIPHVYISELQVQAFQFKDSKTGDFDNGK